MRDILEIPKHLQHFHFFLHEGCPIGWKKLSNQLNHLDLLSVFIEGPVHVSSLLLLFANSKVLANVYTLHLSIMSFSLDDVHHLCGVLGKLESLCCLRRARTDIGDVETVSLAEALKGHTRLTELDLSHSKITSVGLSALAPVIRANKIQHLNISGNEIYGSCDDLALAIADCGETLQSLNIFCTGLLVKGVLN